MKKEFKLLPPTMPNFIRYEAPVGRRQDGFNPEHNVIPITELTQSEATAYGELMKQTFIDHWSKKAIEAIPPVPPSDRTRYSLSQTTPKPPNYEND